MAGGDDTPKDKSSINNYKIGIYSHDFSFVPFHFFFFFFNALFSLLATILMIEILSLPGQNVSPSISIYICRQA